MRTGKGLQLSNPSGKGVVQLKQQEFLQQLKDTVVEAVKEARSNPNGTLSQPVAATPSVPAAPVIPTRKQTERSARRQRDKILAAVDDALSALDEGREDAAADILDDVLEEYSEDDEDEER
jgi:DNA-binding ferritin-like protein